MAEPMDKLSIGYETLVSCRVTVVSEIAGDPGEMASSLFQHRFISEETKDKVSELDQTKKKKARLLVDDVESKVKLFPSRYEEFLTILSKTMRYADLVKMLRDKYTEIEVSKSFQDDNTLTPLKPSEPVQATNKKDAGHTTDGISGPSTSLPQPTVTLRPFLYHPGSSKPCETRNNVLFPSIFCCCFTIWIFVTLLLGICGAVVYDPFSLLTTTSVAQIHRPSIPLIGTLDSNSLQRITVDGTDDLSISFYTLQQCSLQDSFINIKVDQTVTVSFDSPTEKSKSLTDWYFLGNTTLTTVITTSHILPVYPVNYCIAYLVAFNDLNKFNDFKSSSFLSEDYIFKECIENLNSHTIKLTFDQQSYYYLGLYSDIPAEVDVFFVHFSGSYRQYNILNSVEVCSTDSATCYLSIDTNLLSQDSCIIGALSSIDTLSRMKGATVNFATATLSDSTTDVYFFIPFMLSAALFLCLLFPFICNTWCTKLASSPSLGF